MPSSKDLTLISKQLRIWLAEKTRRGKLVTLRLKATLIKITSTPTTVVRMDSH